MPDLAPHQRAAVTRALALLAQCGGAILADDVGLGKSYVAARIACALQCRGSAVEIVVPASLVAQWRETLRDFGVDARILTHDALVSDPSLGEGERLIIVDEAHAFRNRRTQRWCALARRSVGARLLLVTATPICNSPDDLLALVSLIAADDALRVHGVASIGDAFAVRDGPSLDIIVRELVIRREHDVLPPELRFGTLERHVIRHPIVDAPIDKLQFPLSASAPLLRQFLWRRLESSPAALLESARRQLRFYERVIESGRALSRRDYHQAFAAEEDGDAIQQILFWDLLAPADGFDTKAIREEMDRLAQVRLLVERAQDTKAALLESALTGEPTLIFTGAAATARSLARLLRCGLATARDGSSAIEAFRRGTIDRLVATDLASEGLNLQRAGVVVHYDIPWNPVKLDQRNGRAHRIGQTRESVRAIYFLPEAHSRIVETVASKNRTRRRILGLKQRTEEIAPPHVYDLPQRLPSGSPALNLIHALRAHGLNPPPALFRRHRAGVEQLFAEMAREYLDGRRVAELVHVLERESVVTGASSGNRDVLPARGTDDASELAAIGTRGQERAHQ
ncbi:MAG TPA: helicase-related protein [Thermoanaerobaculia bacterium]|nr:helicase-related protein [Thermoanaerobaculia bacterium]